MYELVKAQAIHHPVVTSLPEILPLLTREALYSLAQSCEFPGRSKMNKQALIEALPASLSSDEYLTKILLLANDRELDLFNQVIQKDSMSMGGNYRLYDVLTTSGLLYIFYEKDKLYSVVPEDIKNDCSTILRSSSYRKMKKRYDEVTKCINAATNLYGFIELEELTEIFNQHDESENKLDFYELIEICHSLWARDPFFWLSKKYLVSDAIESEEELEELVARTQHKPRYTPDRK